MEYAPGSILLVVLAAGVGLYLLWEIKEGIDCLTTRRRTKRDYDSRGGRHGRMGNDGSERARGYHAANIPPRGWSKLILSTSELSQKTGQHWQAGGTIWGQLGAQTISNRAKSLLQNDHTKLFDSCSLRHNRLAPQPVIGPTTFAEPQIGHTRTSESSKQPTPDGLRPTRQRR